MRKVPLPLVTVLLVVVGLTACDKLFPNEEIKGRQVLYAVESSSTSARAVVIEYTDETATWTIEQNLSTIAAWVGAFPTKKGFSLLLNAHYKTAGDPDTLTVSIFIDGEVYVEDWCATVGCSASLATKVP